MTYIVLKAPLNSNQPTNQPLRNAARYWMYCKQAALSKFFPKGQMLPF